MAGRVTEVVTGRDCLRRSNLDEMLSLSGNTAVYILYAHARIASIIKKIGKDVMEVVKTAHIKLEHPAEVSAPPGGCRFILSCMV